MNETNWTARMCDAIWTRRDNDKDAARQYAEDGNQSDYSATMADVRRADAAINYLCRRSDR